jgi:hypothetical protein
VNSPTRFTAVAAVTLVAALLRDHDDTAALLLRLADCQDAGDLHGFDATLWRLSEMSPLLKELTHV